VDVHRETIEAGERQVKTATNSGNEIRNNMIIFIN
jgi:hypothetical protein